jgi:hypothetical protein
MNKHLPLLPVLAVLAFAACGGGGCGGPDAGPGPGAQPGAGEAPGKKPASGGSVDFSEFDSKQWQNQHPDGIQYKSGPSGASQGGLKALPPPQNDWLDPVTPGDWPTTVLRSAKPVLVMISRPNCADCAMAGSALKMLEPRAPDDLLRRFNGAAPEAPSLISPALLKTAPSFVLYDGGKPVSSLAGLPFSRAKNESDADYRVRLYRWFRDALTQKDLRFGRH